MFVDIFNYIEFDLSKPQGTIELRLNGRACGIYRCDQRGRQYRDILGEIVFEVILAG